jgi:hypothetical protein
MLGAKVEISV